MTRPQTTGKAVTLIAAGTIVIPERPVGPGWVAVRGDRIHAVGSGRPSRRPDVDLGLAIIVPGFVDMHVHGGGGASYSASSPAEIARAAAFHRSHGTTTSVASLVTDRPAQLRNSVGLLAELVADGIFAGIHLEGPWLNRAHAGAHDPTLLRAPDLDGVDALLLAGRGAIRMVTIAPELDGGLTAVHRIVDAGAVAAVGHTGASHECTRAAIAAGATVATHLFNAMRPFHHRAPGPALALLDDPRVTLELIGDGNHLHRGLLHRVITVAGPTRIAAVTDATAAAGAPDGVYPLGPIEICVAGGLATRREDGAIAGSTATMDEVFRRIADVSGLPAPEALRAAVETTATTPARALGLTDVGALRPDYRADIVVLDAAHRLLGVMSRGRWAVQPATV